MSDAGPARRDSDLDEAARALMELAHASSGDQREAQPDPIVPEPVPLEPAVEAANPTDTPAVQLDSAFSPPYRAPTRRETGNPLLVFKRIAIPPMLVMTAVMFALGTWAVLALSGHSFLTDEPDEAVDRLAKTMLLCWPVGILMTVGVVVFRRDVRRGR
jgi:hypothetical protein